MICGRGTLVGSAGASLMMMGVMMMGVRLGVMMGVMKGNFI